MLLKLSRSPRRSDAELLPSRHPPKAVPSKAGCGLSMVGSAPGPGACRTTTFLLSNLHCASCVSNIEDVLFRLVPRPSSVDTSIVSQTVTVRHHPSLPELTLSNALGDAGFEIYNVVRDAGAGFNTDDGAPNESALAEQDGWIDRAAEVWWRRYKSANKSEKKRIARHFERCDICREEKGVKSEEGIISTSTVGQGKSFTINYWSGGTGSDRN